MNEIIIKKQLKFYLNEYYIKLSQQELKLFKKLLSKKCSYWLIGSPEITKKAVTYYLLKYSKLTFKTLYTGEIINNAFAKTPEEKTYSNNYYLIPKDLVIVIHREPGYFKKVGYDVLNYLVKYRNKHDQLTIFISDSFLKEIESDSFLKIVNFYEKTIISGVECKKQNEKEKTHKYQKSIDDLEDTLLEL